MFLFSNCEENFNYFLRCLFVFSSSFRLIIMFFILPETEQRSLEDIELHYVDNTKKITDIRIEINDKAVELDDD